MKVAKREDVIRKLKSELVLLEDNHKDALSKVSIPIKAPSFSINNPGKYLKNEEHPDNSCELVYQKYSFEF